MARKPQKMATGSAQLEPLLKAFMLKRLQQEPGGPNPSPKAAKARPKKRKKA